MLVMDGGGARRPMRITCHGQADDFRAWAMAYPMVPLAPVSRQTFS